MFLSVGEELRNESAERLQKLISKSVASEIFEQNSGIWGPEAQPEASIRLGWTDPVENANGLIPKILKLRDELRAQGLDRVVLCGMGGSSLAPEVICKSEGVSLTILDSTAPRMVRYAVTDLEQTVVVVSSKSGSTVETASQKAAFEQAFEQAGIDPRSRMIIVTDPGSPLFEEGMEKGYTVFEADPNVGGRYSALTAFGLVPAGLAGANISKLIADAKAIIPALSGDNRDNPGLLLASAISGSRDRFVLNDSGTSLQGISDWVEQLIAESTGKDGKGILPVCGDPEAESKAEVSSFVPARISNQTAESSWIHLDGSLGELFMAFEVATAAAGFLIGINPFDQPDVESAKKAARESLLLDSSSAEYSDLSEARQLCAEINREGYLSVQLYASSYHSSPIANLRERLVAVSKVPVTIGWGPRFLHSTGQFHKGGKPGGAFIQIIQADDEYPIPGAEFGFQQLIEAQAKGDASVLRANGSRVVTIKLGKEEDVVDVLEKLVE